MCICMNWQYLIIAFYGTLFEYFSAQMHIEILYLTVLFPRSNTLQDNSIDFPFIAVIVLRIAVVSNVGPCTFFSLSFSDIE